LARGATGSAVKWPPSPGASCWLVDVSKEEKNFVFNLGNLALKVITAYQKYLRPYIPAGCRFQPGCSEYTKQAILKYGLINGVFKGLIRISRCHPFSGKSGYDPLI
jgi:hypothetical protein